jgi:two-component system, LuxR family, response regulator FixJ
VNESRRQSGSIAIVDDDQPVREALDSVLKAAGLRTETFATAEEFLESSNRETTACLILDVRLPRMSGIELQKRLIEVDSQVPIIFVTAHGDASMRDLLLKAGAAAFLNKPVRSDALLKEIDSVLEKGRPNQEI